MNNSAVTVQLDRDNPVYHPGETLSAAFRLPPVEGQEVKAVEVSVLWYTEGKGEEDLGVHHFARFTTQDDGLMGPGHEQRISTRLPRSPLSYDGVIIKIHWCVRVRVFWNGGKEMVGEAFFRLGQVPPAEEVSP
jgi:hypothetical protein